MSMWFLKMNSPSSSHTVHTAALAMLRQRQLKLVINDLPCWHLTPLSMHTGPVMNRPALWYWKRVRGV